MRTSSQREDSCKTRGPEKPVNVSSVFKNYTEANFIQIAQNHW